MKARSGSGRLMTWQPAGRTVETPNLAVPETSLGVPDWADVVLTATATGRDAIEIVSGGTWFHPRAPLRDGSGTTAEQSGADALFIVPQQPGSTGTPLVISVGDELAVFHDAGGWATDPKRAVPAFIDAWTQAGGGRVFYAPAMGTPADYAVWAYLGVDLFDASPLLLAAVRATALTVDGPMAHDEAKAVFGAAADDLVTFNLEQARQELANVRRAIRSGTLRALAERRAYASPDAVALLRRFDHEWHHLESRSPVNDTRPVPCMTQESLWAPEVERFRQRVRDEYAPPPSADILVLFPCSAKKPYRISKTHRYFLRALDDSGMRHRVHEVMVTSPLGIVPRELEDTYPANLYDVPVTGHWNRDEEAIIRQQVAALLDKKDYAHVIGHVPTGTWTFLRDLFPENTLHTALGRPSSIEDCDRLKAALRAIRDAEREQRAARKTDAPDAVDDEADEDAAASDAGSADRMTPVPAADGSFRHARSRKLEDLRGLLSMQFGTDAADRLTSGASVRGKVPFVKLFDHEGRQLGQTTIDRGMLSLTLEGAAIVAAARTKRVYQGDFQIRKTGSLFAAGVEGADADVRVGDDVVVMRGDQITGCGVAQMTGAEMRDMKRGVAVTLRHVVKAEDNLTERATKEVPA